MLAPKILPAIAAAALLQISTAPAAEARRGGGRPRATNTNECIRDLGGVQVCQQLDANGLPSDLGACCDGLRALAQDRCECNPTIDLLLGPGGDAIYDLEPVCRLKQFFKWIFTPIRPFRSCRRLERRDYGCGANDMQVDAARLGSVFQFQSLFATAGDEGVCFDTPRFVASLERVFEPDVDFFVPYGIGLYSGYDDVAEYLGIAFAGLNHGYWFQDLTPTGPGLLEVSEDGSTWRQGGTQAGVFLRGTYPYADSPQQQVVGFDGCETRVQSFNVTPTEGLRDWVEFFVQTVDYSKRWGVEDICRNHDAFCTGDLAQFASNRECVDYMAGLPLFTEACGENRPLNGNSVTCKFKHHFMVPANPPLHCPHIGPLGAVDPSGEVKCDDVAECSDPDEGSDWPPVGNIGADTPREVIDIIEASNVGFEDEPLGCAIPTQPAV